MNMMNMTSDGWRDRVAQIDSKIEAQHAKIAAAQDSAADAVAGGNEPDIGNALQIHMSELQALQAGRTKAEAERASALTAEQAVRAEAEMKLAYKAAKARHDAAAELDEALTFAEKALVRFNGHGFTYSAHISNAGRKAPSQIRLASGEFVRGAMMHAAPTLAAVLMVPRTAPEFRVPLQGIAARQTPWEPQK